MKPFVSASLSLPLFLFLSAGCTASPKSLCKESIEITCAKMHECTTDKTADNDNDGVPDFEEQFGATTAECEKMFDEGYSFDIAGFTTTVPGAQCDSLTTENACDDDPNGATFDAAAASECNDGWRAMTCDELNSATPNIPEACQKICT